MADLATWTVALVGLSVLIINAFKRDSWAPSLLAVFVLVVTTALFVGGQYLDGLLVWDAGLLQRFFFAITGNQVLFQLIKNTQLMDWLEGIGQVPSTGGGVSLQR